MPKRLPVLKKPSRHNVRVGRFTIMFRASWRTDDLEPEPEHDEPDAEGEPSLGSVGGTHFDQTRWADGGRRDLELDGAESGIGDLDGLLEQIGSQDWQHGGQG